MGFFSNRWIRRLRVLRERSRMEREMDEEMRFHVEMEAEELIRSGLPPQEARRQAMIAFGGVERHKEAGRDARGVRWLLDLGADLRYAWRGLRRTPGWSAVAVGALALGIGANTAVFSIVNWTLLRPVPGVSEPDELVIVEPRAPDGRGTGMSLSNLADLEAATPALSGLVGIAGIRRLQVGVPGSDAVALEGVAVAGDYFGVLGVGAQHGRLFTAGERAPSADARVVVLSDHLWRRLFDRDAGVLGRTLTLNGSVFTVVGVAERGFRGTERAGETDLWLPPSAYPVLRHQEGMGAGQRSFRAFMHAVGRLAPGATPELAQAQLRAAMTRLVEAYPEENEIHEKYVPAVFEGFGTSPLAREREQEMALLLAAMVGVVLLIACANVSNLLLFRGVRRRGETAVRRAIGASSGRLFRQHLSEGLLLALLGGAAGVLVAVGLVTLFRTAGLPGLRGLPGAAGVGTDLRVLGFTLGLAFLTGLLFGTVPSVPARRLELVSSLKGTSRTDTGRGQRLRAALTVFQFAASMALVVGALLIARTVANLNRVDLGFDPRGLVVFTVDPGAQGYTDEQVLAFRSGLLERVREIPGVASATVSTNRPFSWGRNVLRIQAAPGDDVPTLSANTYFVGDEFFSTLRLPLRAGSTIQAADWRGRVGDGPPPVVLSRSLAEQLFGSASPIGRTVWEDGYNEQTAFTVRGVVEDAHAGVPREAPDPTIYVPLGASWAFQTSTSFTVRSLLPLHELDTAIRDAVASLNPAVPVLDVEPMPQSVANHMAEERLLRTMLSLFSALALGLAAVGLYGVVAYSVAQRSREIGVRMALGASRAAVVHMVVRQSAALVAIGLVVGLAGAVALGRVLESRLFGVAALDPLVYGLAAALFAAVALLASAAPARAATRVDPVRALRSD